MESYEPGRNNAVYVIPKKEWADHAHRLALWGSDGYDFFFCTVCLVLSRDEKAYWCLTEAEREENGRVVKEKLDKRHAEENETRVAQ